MKQTPNKKPPPKGRPESPISYGAVDAAPTTHREVNRHALRLQ